MKKIYEWNKMHIQLSYTCSPILTPSEHAELIKYLENNTFGKNSNGIISQEHGCIVSEFPHPGEINAHLNALKLKVEVLSKKFSAHITLFAYDGAECFRIEHDGRKITHATFVIELMPAQIDAAKKFFGEFFDGSEIGCYPDKVVVVAKSCGTTDYIIKLADTIGEKFAGAKIHVISPDISFSN